MITEGEGFVSTDQDNLDSLESEIKEQSLDDLLAAAGYSIATTDEKPAASVQSSVEKQDDAHKNISSEKKSSFNVKLSNGESLSAQYIVGCSDDLPTSQPVTFIGNSSTAEPAGVSRSISVISSPLEPLFIANAEGGVAPAGAVVVFPSGSLSTNNHPPVHIMVHSSDTGECPQGQCKLFFPFLILRKVPNLQ